MSVLVTLSQSTLVKTGGGSKTACYGHIVAERLALSSATASLTGSGLGTGSGSEIVLDRLRCGGILTTLSLAGSDGTASCVTVIVAESRNVVTGVAVVTYGTGIFSMTALSTGGRDNLGGGLVAECLNNDLRCGISVTLRASHTGSSAILSTGSILSRKVNIIQMTECFYDIVNVGVLTGSTGIGCITVSSTSGLGNYGNVLVTESLTLSSTAKTAGHRFITGSVCIIVAGSLALNLLTSLTGSCYGARSGRPLVSKGITPSLVTHCTGLSLSTGSCYEIVRKKSTLSLTAERTQLRCSTSCLCPLMLALRLALIVATVVTGKQVTGSKYKQNEQ